MKKSAWRLVPGIVGLLFMSAITLFWSYWGVAEMYHEGWWGAWYNGLPYLVPMVICLGLTMTALKWPRVGGSLIMVVAVAFTLMFDMGGIVLGIVVMGIGGLFWWDYFLGRQEVPRDTADWSWWRRNWRYLVAIVPALLAAISISAYMLPVVLTRVDDGERGIRLIEGNEVTLVWAPEGPGWNWKQPWGGYPSWQRVALYGVPPIGMEDKPGYGRQEDGSIVFATAQEMAETNLCRYLSDDGSALLDVPVDYWRMPTTDEMVRSLGRHGENAGCAWRGEYKTQVLCDQLPDKESPLWNTELAPIYYWTADEYSENRGYFVAFNGTVNATYKLGGNPRHSYRCVREP